VDKLIDKLTVRKYKTFDGVMRAYLSFVSHSRPRWLEEA
jgi:hypothetical protein